MFHVKQWQFGGKSGPKTVGAEAKIRAKIGESSSVQSQNLASLLVEQRTGIFPVLSTPLIELPIQKHVSFVACGQIVSRETMAILDGNFLAGEDSPPSAKTAKIRRQTAYPNES